MCRKASLLTGREAKVQFSGRVYDASHVLPGRSANPPEREADMKADGELEPLPNGMQPKMGWTVVLLVRVARETSLLQFAGVGLLAGSLLLIGLDARAQEPTKQQDKLYEHESGFLGDSYSKLQPDPGNGDWLTYFKTPDVLKNSDTFILEPVKVYLVPEAQQRDIPQEQLDKLSEYFTKAMTDELAAGHYKLVTEPGPGVMKLQFAITNVQPNGNKKNMVATGATDAALYGATPPGTGMLVPRLTVGRVSIEGEMVDSTSGEVEMAFMTSKSGRRFFSGLKAFQKWGDIDAAFRGWAKNFRARLDKAHRA
jgi:hypothetical protein